MRYLSWIILLLVLILLLIQTLRERRQKKENDGVTGDTTIGELLERDRGVAKILMAQGMHCVGCPSSTGESLNEAARVHGIDPEALLSAVRTYFQDAGT